MNFGMLGFIVAGFGLGILAAIRAIAEAFWFAGFAAGAGAVWASAGAVGFGALVRVVRGGAGGRYPGAQSS